MVIHNLVNADNMNNDFLIKEKLREVASKVLPKGATIWLYGSKARGDSNSNSDWDLLILIDKDQITSKDEDNINYPFVLLGWQQGACINPLLYTYKDWEQRVASPFYHNVEKDKIVIL